jgi:AraC-like DNA-binding protein
MMDITRSARFHRGASGGSRWEMVTRPPADALRPYVCADYVGYTEHTDGPCRRREFAVPFAVLIIEFGPPISVTPLADPRRRISHRGGFTGGLDDGFAICEHDGYQHGVQIFLTPIGARLLFRMPMSELAGRIVSIDDVLPLHLRNLRERLRNMADWNERFDVLDAVLSDGLSHSYTHTPHISWAVQRIEDSGGVLDLKALAREMGYSQKHMTTLFRDHIGVAPKRFARIVRFHRLVTHLRSGAGGNWADLAARFGYADQPHLVHEVRALTGITPTELRPLTADLLSAL